MHSVNFIYMCMYLQIYILIYVTKGILIMHLNICSILEASKAVKVCVAKQCYRLNEESSSFQQADVEELFLEEFVILWQNLALNAV